MFPLYHNWTLIIPGIVILKYVIAIRQAYKKKSINAKPCHSVSKGNRRKADLSFNGNYFAHSRNKH